jgi:hypothetical protein
MTTSTALLLADYPKTTDTPTNARGVLPKNFKALGLTDSQKKAIYNTEAFYGAKIDQHMEAIRDLKAQQLKALESLLTDAQKARLREIRLGEADKTKDTPPAKPTKEPADK